MKNASLDTKKEDFFFTKILALENVRIKRNENERKIQRGHGFHQKKNRFT